MKYIRFKGAASPVFVCFPEFVEHRAVADAMRPICGEPVSAGFCDDGKCYGESEGLGLASREEDTRLMRIVMQ
jgi:hypothetical protein